MRHLAKRYVVSSILCLVVSATAANAQLSEQTKAEVLKKLEQVSGKKAIIGLEPSDQDAWRTRDELNQILNVWYPPSMREILQLDPSLLTNETYLTSYPKLAAFLNDHPEVAHNPTYFVGVHRSNDRGSLEPVAVALGFFGVCGMLLWLIRLVVDYRRWLRISRLQTEAQAKILDRFTSNADLLGFIQTPAGRRFMEASATPIEPRSVGAPFGRILWSVQIGLVLLFTGVGMQLLRASSAVEAENLGEAFLIIGGLLIAIGIGFVFSGLTSYLLSRRFGLLEPIAQDLSSGSGGAQTPSSSS